MDGQDFMANIKEKLHNFYFTEDKKLKWKAWFITVFIGLSLLYMLMAYIIESQKTTTAGEINIDRNIIIPREKNFNLELGNYDQEGQIKIDQSIIEAEVRKLLPQLLQGQKEELRYITAYGQAENLQQIADNIDEKLEILKQDIISLNEQRLSDIMNRLSNLENRSGSNLANPNYTGYTGYTGPGSSPVIGTVTSEGKSEYVYADMVPSGSAIIFDNSKPSDISSIVSNFGERSSLSYQIGKGVNVGTLISANLETGAVSSGDKCPVKVTTTEDVYINNQVVIPRGSYFIGYGISDLSTRKVYFYLEKLVIGKREIGIRAHLIQNNMQPGFLDKFIDKTKSTLWRAAILDFCAAAAQSFKDTIYIVSDNGIPTTYYPNTVNNAALDGITNALSKYAEKMTVDASRMGYIMIVNPNKECKIFIDEKIPIDKLITTISR